MSAVEVTSAPVGSNSVAHSEPMDTTPAPAAKGSNRGQKRAGKTASPSKPRAAAKKSGSDLHPKYSQMIEEAIANLKERNGSSRQAILRYILTTYSSLTDKRQVNNHLKMSLRTSVKSGKLRQAKGSGACGSYKLGETKNKGQKKTAKSSTAKTASLTKVKMPGKAVAKVSKPGKKPKSAKSPKKSAEKVSPKKSAKTAKGTLAKPTNTPAKRSTKSPKKSAAKAGYTLQTPKKQQQKKQKKQPTNDHDSTTKASTETTVAQVPEQTAEKTTVNEPTPAVSPDVTLTATDAVDLHLVTSDAPTSDTTSDVPATDSAQTTTAAKTKGAKKGVKVKGKAKV